LIFRLCCYRFHFRAIETVYFPPGKASNILRGALGTTLRLDAGGPLELNRPSGLKEPPRPFVLRAAHLDGKRMKAGETFFLDVNVFDLRKPLLEPFVCAFREWARTGLGPRRGLVELIEPLPDAAGNVISLDLTDGPEASECSVIFRTPTELKGNPSREEMPFGVLFSRVRDRISTLRSFYGEGPLQIDFSATSGRADLVRTVKCDLAFRDISRLSSRTGAVHGIGGVVGQVDYAGELAEFLPFLRAGWWIGAGRHTVWGNGVIEVVHSE
jgi:CRISPR-associated endoribonuclease Cas6